MKLTIIKQEKELLEFYIEGERHTLPNILREKLLKDSDVEFCAYTMDHPIENKSRFLVRGKNPKKSIESAIKEVKENLDEFRKVFAKAKK